MTQGYTPEIVPKPLPAPPDGMTPDADQLDVAEERWTECPLKACKRDKELLYQDFYLRDVRTNRVMCSACAVRTEIGYIAKEVVKETDDKFFQGTNQDYVTVGLLTAVMSTAVNMVAFFFPIFFFIWIFIGGAAGSYIGARVRQATGGRIGRRSWQVAVAGVVVGFFIGGFVWGMLSGFGQLFFVNPVGFIQILFYKWSALIATGAMAFAVYGIFQRRI